MYPYGVVHELEIAEELDAHTVGRSLVEACVHWLTERGAKMIYATASDQRERALYRSMGFEHSDSEMHRLAPPQPIQAGRQTWA